MKKTEKSLCRLLRICVRVCVCVCVCVRVCVCECVPENKKRRVKNSERGRAAELRCVFLLTPREKNANLNPQIPLLSVKSK